MSAFAPEGSGDTAALRRDGPWLALLVLATLLPFAGKAVHVDDPMWIWIAEHVLREPADFYGFSVNWHGIEESLPVANNNPPTFAYYMAAIGALAGFGERALHVGMLPLSLAALCATHLVARRLCGSPRTAALLAWSLPALLVSSTTLMAESLLLASWCGAVWLWLRGIEERSAGALVAAGALAALCALTKFFGVALVPLLAAHGLARRRRPGAWLLPLLLPIAALAAYELTMRSLYDHSPLAQAAELSDSSGGADALEPLRASVVALTFLGGACLGVLGWAGWLASRRALLLWGAGALLASGGLPLLGSLAGLRLEVAGAGALLQIALFAAVGAALLAIAADDLRRTRSPESLLLALWLAGVFAFAGFVNWTVSVRALAPAAPAVAILCARRVETRRALRTLDASPRFALALVPGLALSLAVAGADARLAETARTAARELTAAHDPSDGTLWFQGAWGFQYYLQRQPAAPRKLDFDDSTLQPGDRVILPREGPNVLVLPLDVAVPVARERYATCRWLATVSHALGAGFYSQLWGPLPYAFGRDPGVTYEVLEVRRRFATGSDSWLFGPGVKRRP